MSTKTYVGKYETGTPSCEVEGKIDKAMKTGTPYFDFAVSY